MKKWFYRLSKGRQIAAAVLAVHFLFLTVLSIQYFWHKLPAKRHKVAINMVRIEPPKAKASAPKKTASQPAKKQTPTAKKAPAKPTPKTEPVVSNQLLKDLAESLEKVTTISTPSPPKPTVHIPQLSETKQQEPLPDGTAEEKVALYLQDALTLPEFGEVRAQLTIDRLGRLQSLEIITAQSEKNALFLKNRLPELQFPCLNESVSLTVVFSNAL